MKEAVASWEPQARAVLRIMAIYMIFLHGLREVFGLVPARPRGPGSFMPLDPLGHVGGVLLLVLGLLVLVGWFARAAALLLALQCAFAYFYAAAPRGVWPIRNGGIDTLTYVFVFLYLAGAGPGAWSLDALLHKKKYVASAVSLTVS
jgi:putative oxidoreductase